eukprot:gene7792-9141_t
MLVRLMITCDGNLLKSPMGAIVLLVFPWVDGLETMGMLGSKAVCIPSNIACKCTAIGDRCGSNVAPACSGLSQHSVYGCDAIGSYPSLKWSCPNGCTTNTPAAAGNDTCFRGPPNTDGLKKVKHIVIFMQENRAFDHYYGLLPGVRGYSDPQPFIMKNQNNTNVFQQPDSKSSDINDNGIKYSVPYHILGPHTDCTDGGSNSWSPNHKGWNNGLMDSWTSGITPSSMGFLNRDELDYYYSLTELYTIGDMYFQSIMSSTNPNRLVLWTGTVDGLGQTQRGPSIDNAESPPFQWLTFPEQLEKASITWRVYQDSDNFDDNALEWFQQYQDAPSGNSLHDNGYKGQSLDKFLNDSRDGTLPQVSYVIAPTQLSEHPLNGPAAGQWLSQEIINALTSSPEPKMNGYPLPMLVLLLLVQVNVFP